MELRTIQDIERAIDALPPQQWAELYAGLDRHRPHELSGTQTSIANAEVGKAEPMHIWDLIANNMKDVPPRDFAALPKDGLSQIDHYVYGVPKAVLTGSV